MISPICINTNTCFKKSSPVREDYKEPEQRQNYENPISRSGEALKLIKTTFVAGIMAALVFLGNMAEVGFELGDGILEGIDALIKKAKNNNVLDEKDIQKIKEKAEKKAKEIHNRKLLTNIGAGVALFVAGICGFAALYTLYNAPKISYESKINKFKKGQEMDVYIKANEAERELYTELDERAKTADTEEKEALKEQYLKMKNAKNQVPDFVKLKKITNQ